MGKTLRVLLVDDDETDREIFRMAMEQVAPNCHLEEAIHGEAALHYITSHKNLPHIIFLDLNMPVKDGRKTLEELKSHSQWKVIPVCILSTSSAHFDVISAYANGVNFYLVKPFDFKELSEMLQSLFGLLQKSIILPTDLDNEEILT